MQLEAVKTFANDVGRAYWILLKILVPAVMVVKILQELGATELLASLLAPLMNIVGLPSEFGLVWAASILTNIYAAMVVFYELGDGSYSVAQITTLAMLVLVAHAIPIEGAVAKALGVSWRITILLRCVGGFVFALITYFSLSVTPLAEQTSQALWTPSVSDTSFWGWVRAQFEMLAGILVVLSSLMLFLRFLRLIKFDQVLEFLLLPLTKLLKVGREASHVTIVGLMLGLSFGAGLLIDAAKKGEINSRDMKVVACFLGLCHSIIEDTLLLLLLGAHWIPILLGRLLLSIIVMAILIRFMFKESEKEPDFS
ncbi:MAG: hypothetical protein MK096_09200 [Oleiphilaceae bacterium]|nr:hypothetical protein [Oleiphilus sp. HI0125]KZZ61631.1 hypothetical protein A3762_14050 [Oleiphilus sp. HI0125]MCH2158934.1 hypothetical protein [Oleiphilaceae bacterium]